MSTEEKEERKKCNRCFVNLPISKYSLKKDDTYQKSCDNCGEKQRISRGKNKCSHGKRKYDCAKCGGVSTCKHKIKRYECRVCSPHNFCSHNRLKGKCKPCMTEDKRQAFIIRRMIISSRHYDIKKGFYDEDTFVDTEFLTDMMETYKNCMYCNQPFTYTERIGTFVTIERVDSTLSHSKDNCILACFSCNTSKK